MPAIFIVDDDHDILQPLELWFQMKEYNVFTFDNSKNLIDNITREKPDIILLDIMLKGEDGRYLCRKIKETVPYPVKVLLFSASPGALLSYEDNFADGIINKPFDMEDVYQKCRKLLTVKHGWFS